MAVAEAVGNRKVVLASADAALRGRLRESLRSMRWSVREAAGGAEAMAQMEEFAPEALLMDGWLPDLEVSEFAGQVRQMFPNVDLLRVDGDGAEGSGRSPRRHELLHALREALDHAPAPPPTDTAAWSASPMVVPSSASALLEGTGRTVPRVAERSSHTRAVVTAIEAPKSWLTAAHRAEAAARALIEPALRHGGVEAIGGPLPVTIPGLVGSSAPMLELARLVRLVAPRNARVLIEGETGTGKELVAKALHVLSTRAQKPLVTLNCAAIPEALLEAELFGHTRGAFTGAVHSRTGRIEAAHGGTLFLDEIGEMPLPLQAKMLRFLESGELQRVGENDSIKVDVRVVAATHQPLEERSEEGSFRLDLFHRLAVFPIEVPPLRERMDDLPLLVEHFLSELGRDAPRKRMTEDAMDLLRAHPWPGNVRELAHVLQRATILTGEQHEIGPESIRLRRNRPRDVPGRDMAHLRAH